MSRPLARARTRLHNTTEVKSETFGAIDSATHEGMEAMDDAQGALQRQLRTGEITQDAYEEALTSLMETAPPAVLKASMEQRQDVIKAALGQAPDITRA